MPQAATGFPPHDNIGPIRRFGHGMQFEAKLRDRCLALPAGTSRKVHRMQESVYVHIYFFGSPFRNLSLIRSTKRGARLLDAHPDALCRSYTGSQHKFFLCTY